MDNKMKPVLVLRLVAPLQSWSERSIGKDVRDTSAYPTKSGVIGLLGCAMGIPRGDERLHEMSKSLRMAVRADNPGVIDEDYQTVRAKELYTADGGKRKPMEDGYATIIVRRMYLQDAGFTVFLFGDNDLLQCIASALQCPKWAMYLGRKAYVPSLPILDKLTECDDIEGFIAKYPILNSNKELNLKEKSCMVEIEDGLFGNVEKNMGNKILRLDGIGSSYQTFYFRYVYRKKIELAV